MINVYILGYQALARARDSGWHIHHVLIPLFGMDISAIGV